MFALLPILVLLAAPDTQPASGPVVPPSDWPPVPDFRKPVDYLRWKENRWAVGKYDNAAPLWDALAESESDPPDVAEAKRKRWGKRPDGSLPGLFMGIDPRPERLGWDPKDHPDWEAAWEATKELRGQIFSISRKRCYRATVRSAESLPAGIDDSTRRLLINASIPRLSVVRAGVKVLLQSAWRSPDGKTDSTEMKWAIMACLRIARQQEALAPSLIQPMVGQVIRELTYDTALRALDGGVFSADDVAEIDDFLATQDRWPVDPLRAQPDEAAMLLDLLQFVYLPIENGMDLPRPDRSHLAELTKLVKANHESAPDLYPAPLDLNGEIERCTPATAIQQLIELHLAIRDIVAKQLPTDADARVDALFKQFASDPSKHVLLRQHLFCSSRSITLCARTEAYRRATRTIFALHRAHRKTGQWPASLNAVPSVLSSWRIDPFSRKAFVYKITDSVYRSAPDGMKLYSVACNGQDDGGRHGRFWGENWKADVKDEDRCWDTDYVFWPVQPNRR